MRQQKGELMGALRNVILVTSCLITVFSIALSAQATGVIKGIVVDEHAAPIKGVTIEWHRRPLEGEVPSLWNGPEFDWVHETSTDESGKFTTDALAWGKYAVLVEQSSALTLEARTEVVLSPKNPIAELTLKVPTPGIVTGTLLADAPPQNVEVEVCRLEAHKRCETLHGIARHSVGALASVPPDVDLSFEVRAKGYRTWSYIEQNGTALKVHPGEKVDLGQIRLQADTATQK
ncbi:MAG: carboxypeptidase-like regulatory domain-containing protein [Terriglobales bacterium]